MLFITFKIFLVYLLLSPITYILIVKYSNV